MTIQNYVESRFPRLADAYEKLGDAVTIVDPNERLIFVNSAFEILYGYSREEILNRPLSQIVPQSRFEVTHAMVLSAPNERWEGDVTRVRKSGEEFPAHLTVTVLHDSRGDAVGRVAVVRDLTEVRQREARIERDALEEAALGDIGRIITSSLNIHDVYERFSERVAELFSIDRITVNLVDLEQNVFRETYLIGANVPDREQGAIVPLAGTITQELVRTRSGIVLQGDDLRQALSTHFPGALPGLDSGLRSFLSVPLIWNDRVIGTLHLRSVTPNCYSQRDLALAQRIGDQIAGAIANSQLHAELQRSETEQRRLADENAVLAEIGRVIGSTLDIDEVYERFSSEVGKLIPFDRLSIGIPDEVRQYNTIAYLSGIQVEGRKRGDPVVLEGTLALHVIRSMSTVLIQSVTREHLEAHVPGLVSNFDDGLRSFLTVPLIHHDRLVGVLQIRSTEDRVYSERHVAVAERVGSQIAGALASSLLYAQVRDAEEEQRRLAEENVALAEVGRIISSTLDIDEVYERFASQIGKLIPRDRIGIGIPDAAQEYNTVEYMNGTLVEGRNRGDRLAMEGTLAQEVVQRQSTVLIQDVTREHLEAHLPGLVSDFDQGLRSFLSVPLMHHDRLVGVLQIFSKQSSAYSERHLALAERVGSLVAGAVANSLLHARLRDAESNQRRLADEQAVLAEIGQTVSSSLDLDDVLERVAALAQALIPHDRIAMSNVNLDRGTLENMFLVGVEVPDRGRGHMITPTGTVTEEVVRTGVGCITPMEDADALNDSYPGLMPGFEAGLRSSLAVPLTSRDMITGVLHIQSIRANAFADRDLEMANQIAAQISGAIGNARLYEALERDAEQRETLAEISRTVSSSQDLSAVYESFARQVLRIVPFDRMILTFVDSEKALGEDWFVTGAGLDDEPPRQTYAATGTIALEVALRRSGIIVEQRLDGEDHISFSSMIDGSEAGLRSAMAVPVLFRDRPIAAMVFRARGEDAYEEEHLQVAGRVAAQIAGAVATIRLNAELQRRSDERTIIAEIGRVITSSLSIDEVYVQCAEKISELIPCDQVAVNLVDSADDSVVNAYVSGMDVPQHFRVSAPLEGTFTAAAMEDGIILRLGEVPDLKARYPGAVAALERGINMSLGVPLRSRDKVIGVLILQSVDPNAYDQHSLDLAQRVADQMSGAIANAELHATVQRAAHESEVLAKVSRAVSSSTDLNEVLDVYARAVGEIIPVDAAGIGLIDHERQAAFPRHMIVNSEIDLPPRDGRVAFPLEGSVSAEVVEKGTPVVIHCEDPRQLGERFPQLRRYQAGIRSFLAVPVNAGDQVTAVLHFSATDPDAYGPNEMAFAEKVATQISGAVAIARLYADLETKESQLEGSEERNRAIVEAIPDLIFRVREDGTLLDYQGARDEFSPTPEVWLGRHLSEVLPSDVAELAMRNINLAILTGEVQEFEYTLPVPMPHGEMIEWEGRAVKAGDDEVLILARDITERKRLSAELLQAQKMEAVGTLAGGVAHDFNNMLTAITGYTDLAKAALGPDSPVGGYHDEVGKAADRAAGLTRQLLAFSRRQVVNPKVIDLNDIILDMDKMLRRMIMENIELVTLPSENLKLVQADPGHIEQVLMNLAVNASDAMPEGGKLFMETFNVVVDDELASQHAGLASGNYVGLTVRDTGEGMTEEVQSRVFEPFFTTKEVGKGTGLGLSTVYGIVAQNGGAITVESEQGVGTTFRVLLPAAVDEKEDLPLRDDAGFLPTGSETILLVEDEPLVRGVAAEVLRHQGYTVIEAANGVEAVEVALKSREPVDLLVTDVVMPLMGGKALADRLKESQPEIKILYSTGYTEDTALMREVAAHGSSVLQKPFGPTELAERVRNSLDGI